MKKRCTFCGQFIRNINNNNKEREVCKSCIQRVIKDHLKLKGGNKDG